MTFNKSSTKFLIFSLLVALFTLMASAYPTPDEIDGKGHNTPYSRPDLAETTATPTLEPHLESRVAHDIKCDLKGEELGNQKNLKKAFEWLRKERTKEGKPRPRGNRCQTAVCAYGIKIKWCNDNPHEKTRPSWNNVAEGAQVILDMCKKKKNGVQGELDHNDHWRVLVIGEGCYMQPGPEQPRSLNGD
ncbi:hypothetical protein BJY00DRAFT_306442 [Aspergillus carlsbadensis]|nr:hypothetical protein BJY00DRAFT_306442 [Aspergillus carlsbadensis]